MSQEDSRLVQHVVERTLELAVIPAPPNDECDRALLVEEWWKGDGLASVYRDRAGNVWGKVRDGTGPAILVCAHLDTVFSRDVDHTVDVTTTRLKGPGVGDNTVAVASLASLDACLPSRTGPVWILATVGEEGLGNLLGARTALANPPTPVGALIAVEGNYLGRVGTTGVGSCRWRIEVNGPGGHAWECASNPSAVHGAAALVREILAVPSPDGQRSAINVGRFCGGEAINARARSAVLEVDVRSDAASGIAALAASVEGAVRTAAAELEGLRIEVQQIGERPAGSIELTHPLVLAADDALREVGLTPSHVAASTDANAAYAAGIPAITVGITTGGGEHTTEEWIDKSPIATGILALSATIQRYMQRLTT